MTNSDRESAAQFLFAARKRGTPGPRIPAEFRPADTDDALAIQARVTALIGQPVGGYKCSLPSAPRPVFMAPIFAPTIAHASPYPVLAVGATARIRAGDRVRHGTRPSSASRRVHRKRDPRCDQGSASGARDSRIAVQRPGQRDVPRDPRRWPGEPGPARRASAPRSVEQRTRVVPIVIDSPAGVLATYEGKHADGHPLRPLYWLANYLATGGTPLRAGMIVTTGSYCGAVDVPLDTPLTFAYGDLGTLSATLTRA